MDNTNQSGRGRRGFLRNLTIGAGVATVAGTVEADAITSASTPTETTPQRTEPKGYQETAHVKRYYELART